jgi:hypothetical protein
MPACNTVLCDDRAQRRRQLECGLGCVFGGVCQGLGVTQSATPEKIELDELDYELRGQLLRLALRFNIIESRARSSLVSGRDSREGIGINCRNGHS